MARLQFGFFGLFILLFLCSFALAQRTALEFTSYPLALVGGASYMITYNAPNNSPVTLTLQRGSPGSFVTISTISTTIIGGSYQWTVDSSLATASDYSLQLQQGNIFAFSGQIIVASPSAPSDPSSPSMPAAVTATAPVPVMVQNHASAFPSSEPSLQPALVPVNGPPPASETSGPFAFTFTSTGAPLATSTAPSNPLTPNKQSTSDTTTSSTTTNNSSSTHHPLTKSLTTTGKLVIGLALGLGIPLLLSLLVLLFFFRRNRRRHIVSTAEPFPAGWEKAEMSPVSPRDSSSVADLESGLRTTGGVGLGIAGGSASGPASPRTVGGGRLGTVVEEEDHGASVSGHGEEERELVEENGKGKDKAWPLVEDAEGEDEKKKRRGEE